MFHRRAGLPDDWYDIALRSFGHWHELDDDERAQLGDDADWLLRHKSWEAAHGFALSDEMRTVVALEAALLILGLGTDHYREVGAVIMFPTTIASSGVRAGPVRYCDGRSCRCTIVQQDPRWESWLREVTADATMR